MRASLHFISAAISHITSILCKTGQWTTRKSKESLQNNFIIVRKMLTLISSS